MEIDDLTKERIALNQSRFREANERIELAADRMGLMGPIPFICECPEPTCVEIVRLRLEEYEELRHDPRLFLCAPGHDALSVDSGAALVREERDEYMVVEKVGVAGEIAAADYQAQNGD